MVAATNGKVSTIRWILSIINCMANAINIEGNIQKPFFGFWSENAIAHSTAL